ncbi:MAG TPA: hypothetical protein VGX72_14760 [Solirubrobacteraceae bacterium]|nr:hypothetical protein [Solirubrobacteraceae bacterium]
MKAGYQQPTGISAPQAPGPSVVTVGLATFAAIQLGLALFMAASPHGFYTAVGPFGAFNAHYIRDVASFYCAIGVALAVAIVRASWRVPVLALTGIQYALHCVNHLIDIDKAHPAWNGYFDFFSLAAATAALAWLCRAALLEAKP